MGESNSSKTSYGDKNIYLASRLNGLDPYQCMITYCGGGIAATVNAMAYLMAGHKNVVVYEWGLPMKSSR